MNQAHPDPSMPGQGPASVQVTPRPGQRRTTARTSPRMASSRPRLGASTLRRPRGPVLEGEGWTRAIAQGDAQAAEPAGASPRPGPGGSDLVQFWQARHRRGS
jgi:hypothetical protein